MVKKISKKIVTALMAVIMVVISILSPTAFMAGELKEFRVTLEAQDGGALSFSERNAESEIMASEGTRIPLSVNPYDGFVFKDFLVSDSSTGEELEPESVIKDFVLSIPGRDISVRAVFEEVIPQEDSGEVALMEAVTEESPETVQEADETEAAETMEAENMLSFDDLAEESDVQKVTEDLENTANDLSETASADDEIMEETASENTGVDSDISSETLFANDINLEEEQGLDETSTAGQPAELDADELTVSEAELSEVEENTEESTSEEPDDTVEIEETSTDDPEPEEKVYVYIRVINEGGSVELINGSDNQVIRCSEGKLVLENSVEDAASIDPNYGLLLESESGSEMQLKVIPDENYRISEYRELTDSGGTLEEDVRGLESFETVIHLNDKETYVSVGFEAFDPYFISEDYDYSQFYALDFSSMRIMAAASDPDIFTEPDKIISSYNGIYLLQFDDVDTAIRAYAYYNLYADFAEVDTGIMIAEGEAADVVSTYDVMTEDANPFSELEEAIYTSGFGYYDIALIDTGASGANESVSMIGDNAGDDNGHGTSMLGYIRQQNPSASVLSVKALGSDGKGSVSSIYAAIQYAISKNVRIINMSVSAMASADSVMIESAINEAAASGILVVGAAGNNGRNAAYYIPGGIASALIIGAAGENGERLVSSNYGNTVDYNVVSGSTSEAAARFSGFLSANGLEGVSSVLNDGLIYETGYTAAEDDDYISIEELASQNGWNELSYMELSDLLSQYEKSGEYENAANVYDYMVTLFDMTDYKKPLHYKDLRGSEFNIQSGTGTWWGKKGSYTWSNAGSGSVSGWTQASDEPTYAAAGLAVGAFSVSYGGSSYTGFCANHDSDVWSGSGTAYEITSTELSKVLYYGYGGPGNVLGSSNHAFCITALACSRIYSGYDNGNGLGGSFVDQVSGYSAVPSGFHVYCIEGSGYSQPVIFWTFEEESNGNAYFSKSVTKNNGTVRIHKEISGVDSVGTWEFTVEWGTSTSYGNSRTISVTSGSYYDVEIPAGNYYKITEKDYSNSGVSTYIWDGSAYVSGRVITGRIPDDTSNLKYTFTFSWNDGEAHNVWYLPKGADWDNGWSLVGSRASGNTYTLYDGDYLWVDDLAEGTTVTVTETMPSTGNGSWSVNPSSRTLTDSIEGDKTINLGTVKNAFTPSRISVRFKNEKLTGKLAIEKIIDTTGMSADSIAAISSDANYSVDGAQYTVYTNAECTIKYNGGILTITASDSTGMSGSSNEITGLPLGTYYIKETKAGKNLGMDTKVYTVTINRSNYETLQKPSSKSKDAPVLGSVQIEKILDTTGLNSSAVNLIKSSTDYSVDGAQYTIYTDAGCTQKYGSDVLTITASDSTGMSGISNVITGVPFGTYYIKETKPGKNLKTDTQVYSVTINKDNYATTQKPSSKSKDVPVTGSIQIEKITDTEGLSAKAVELVKNSGAYSVSGAQYTVYTDAGCTQVYGDELLTITASDSTGMSGVSNVISGVPFGTYYIKETKVPANMKADTTVYSVTINKDNYATTQKPSSKSKDIPETGSVSLSKVSAVPDITSGNQCYSLAGAKYGIYTDRSCTDLYCEASTDANGQFKVDKMPFGTYYIKELEPSKGYGLADCSNGGAKLHIATLTSKNKDASFTCEEPANGDPIRVLIQKIDKETGKPYPVAGGTFENAEYTVKFYTNYDYSGTPERTWVFTTNAAGEARLDKRFLKQGSDNLYFDKNGQPVIPAGSFTIQETVPPAGYNMDPTVYRYQVNGEEIEYDGNDSGIHPISTTPRLEIDKGQNSPEQVTRGNFEFKKVLDGSERIANALFEVTNTVTGETHYILTDPNGVYNSALFHKNNGNDAAVKQNQDGTITVDEGKLSYESNVWFSADSEGNSSEPNPEYASYPYGTYVFKEIETSVNKGLNMITFTGTVYKDGFYLNEESVYDLGTKDDRMEGSPDIHTIARDAEELDKLIDVSDSECRIIDKVSYFNLNKDEEYILKGKIWDKTNGVFLKDASRNEYEVSKKFTADDINSYTEMEFILSADVLKETGIKSLVVFEWLYKDSELLVTHADPEDQDQAIVVLLPPEIGTTLSDSADEQHDAFAFEGMTLNDTVYYKNLKTGRTYRIDGILMDRNTGKPALDDNGQQITATASFTAETEEGTAVLAFTFDGLTLAGHTLVAFETLYWRNIEQAEHKDLEDEGQTVYVPEISTTLKDGADGDDDALASEEITLIDTVKYSNLIGGKEYTVHGILMDKSTGERTLDDNGNEITSQVTFTPDSSDDEIELAFRFSGVNLAGRSVVAFETLERGDKELAVHADINDEDQTVDIPKIETTLAEIKDSEHDALAEETITLTDTVKYTNLIVGRTYTMKGILMDKDTAQPILDDDGKEITTQKVFQADARDGSVELTFQFRGKTLAGKSIVAFEELYRDNKEVAVHADIEDEDQTVHIPEIKTTLADPSDSEHDVLASEDIVLVDTVEFKNLIVGKEYTVTGTLYDQETNAPALDDNGNEITAESTFTADTTDGKTDITFQFSGITLAGHSVVAFENLYRDSKLLAVHADINDEGQTVDIPEITTTLSDTIDNEHDALAKESIQLVDTVYYHNLHPGREYTMSGTLMDKETGKELLDDEGNSVTSSAVFVPEEPDGSVDIIFNFNGVTLAGKSVVAFEHLQRGEKEVAVHTDINDDDQTVDLPKIRTTLNDTIDSEHDVLASEKIELSDTVSFVNLVPGKKYIMRGILMDKETGEPALDDNGDMIESEAAFTPEKENGSVDITFQFSGVNLAGHTVVAFERLYRDEKLLALHCDIDDFDQSAWIPEIRTTLKDSIDGGKDAYATETIKLTDTVIYSNLIVGKTYKVTGKLYDKESGQLALDDNGKEITAEAAFTCEEPDGSVDVVFEFSGVNLAGRSVVAFEDLYRDNKKVAAHTDIQDEDQTVHLPKIGTSLTDDQTEIHNSMNQAPVTLKDTVTYENLIVGEEYIVKGTLMDKATGKVILAENGSVVTATAGFTAESKNGTVDLTFTLNNIPDGGLTAVAFEELFHMGTEDGEKPVADHKDLEDTEQTVYIPEIRTTLTTKTGLKTANYLGNVVLFDQISYKNLKPGETYRAEGKLMDKESGRALLDASGNEIIASGEFTPESPDGVFTVTFKFTSGSTIPAAIVAFEALFQGNVKIAEHEDINDEDQTVHTLVMATTAHNKTGTRQFEAAAFNTVIDRVSYKGLEAGRKYTLFGTVVDQATGKRIQYNGKDISGSIDFTPHSADGYVDVEIEVPADVFVDKAVVFEQLMDGNTGNVLCAHEDLEDDAQTVFFAEAKTSAVNKADGSRQANLASQVTIIDTVSYQGLEPGREYEITATLINKSNGRVVTSLRVPITSTKTFTPDLPDGTIEMILTVPQRTVKGDTVCFELIKDRETGEVICRHEDINDADQTVTFYSPGTPVTPGRPRTGDENNLLIWIIIGGCAAAFAVTVIIVAKRRRRK